MAAPKQQQHLQLYNYDSLVFNLQRTLEVTLTPRELAQPTSQVVEQLYIKFIQAFYAIDFNDYLLELYHEPETQYADAFVLKIVRRYLHNILSMVTYTSWIEGKTPVPFDDIRISDITDPQPMRTKVILSSLINLVNLRDSELKLYKDVVTQLIRLSHEKDHLEQEKENLANEIGEKKKEAEKREKSVEKDRQKKYNLEQELSEAEKARKKVKQEYKEIKTEVEQKMARFTSLSQQAVDRELANSELRGRLVQSPERVKNEIRNFGDEVEQKRAQLNARQELVRSLEAKLQRLRQIEQDCSVVQEHLKTLGAVIRERDAQRDLVQSLHDDLERQRIEFKKDMANKETWEKKGEAAKDRLSVFQARVFNERQEFNAKSLEVKAEYERAAQERNEADHRIDDDSKQAAELDREIAAMIADYERAIQEALNDYWNMMKQADEFMTVISKRLHLPNA